MKKSFLFLLSSLLLIPSSVIRAEEVVPPIIPEVSLASPASENVPFLISREKRVEKLKSRASREIDRRLASLNKLSGKLKSNRKLGEAEKLSLLKMIEENKVGLSALATQIKDNTSDDIKVVRELVQKIYSDFRVYAVFIPKINALVALNRESSHVTKLNEYFSKVENRLKEAESKGKDVSARREALSKAKIILPEIMVKISLLITKATALQPLDYPALSKQVLGGLKTGIREINSQFKVINQLLRQAK